MCSLETDMPCVAIQAKLRIAKSYKKNLRRQRLLSSSVTYLHHSNRIFATRRWAPAVRLEILSCCDPVTEIALVWCLVANLVIIRVPLAPSGFEFCGFPSMSIGPHRTQWWERPSSRTMKYILSPRCERSSSVGKGPVALHRHSHGIFSLGDH